MSENLRYERGKNIALRRKIKRIEPSTTSATMWKVESETVDDLFYTVIQFSDEHVICTCDDYKNRKEICKHIYAVCLKETATTTTTETSAATAKASATIMSSKLCKRCEQADVDIEHTYPKMIGLCLPCYYDVLKEEKEDTLET